MDRCVHNLTFYQATKFLVGERLYEWSLEYGRNILAGVAAFTGLYINRKFRAKIKLRDFGHLPTALGLFMTPTATVYLLQTEFVLHKLLAYEVSCPVCLESKSAAMQIFGGMFLALLGAPLANFSIAAGSGRFSVPLRNDFRGMLKITRSAYQPLLPKLAILFTVNALLAGFITHSQVESFIYIEQMQHLMEQDKTERLKIQDGF
ncbi:uncharacterized protein LOC105282666 isoform X2 [Ooceraea biroi]|uniref:uncharacterized protein LOC105282666 isoform X2 n=1 Tax=Ooceraea biroi TaxID=2015173 RepID=UPI000F07A462|nr:uncharacterized protein LOC105282666 isoform X2 [Ooceraea biroi]